MQVIDFGAGTGLVCAHVAPLVDKVYAVDISASMLEQLAAKPSLQGKVETVCQDILANPLGHKVDLIISAMAMHHVGDTRKLVAALHAHLKPGGSIALADLDHEAGTFHATGMEGIFHHGFHRDEFERLLAEQGFENVQFETATTVTKEGVDYPIFLVTASKAQS